MPGRRYLLSLLLAGAVGFISLTQEILWMRVVSLMTGGNPRVFAALLGAFLLGIAAGSLAARRVVAHGRWRLLTVMAVTLLAAGVVSTVALPLVALLGFLSATLATLAAGLVVAAIAALLGCVFPLLCEYGFAADDLAGKRTGQMYLANIVGSTAGPLVTGFVLLDLFSLEVLFVAFGVLTSGLGLALTLATRKGRAPMTKGRLRRATVAALVCFVVSGFGYDDGLIPRLHVSERRYEGPLLDVVQTRDGVIAVFGDPAGDVVLGGGKYDGRFNVDLGVNSNRIDRAYAIALLHPKPETVLEIGLSSGSWARVFAAHESVESYDIVEISPGYTGLIADRPGYAELLDDPRVDVHIDDGRRWLMRHPDERFDFILMNTTFHWRSNITNLLSREFLELARAHLKPGGVLYWNTTRSEEALVTAASVFEHVVQYVNFVAGSDQPFDPLTDRGRRLEALARFVGDDGRPLIDPSDPRQLEQLEEHVLTADLGDQKERLLGLTHRVRAITDDNMASEFERSRAPFDGGKTWAAWFAAVFASDD